MIELLLQAERTLSVGLLDEAEALYRRAALQDPRNAIAVVGLARVALERGDERGAYAEAVRALAIDPENAAAVRLETRLAEVFTTRGETVERPPVALEAARQVERRIAAEVAERASSGPRPAPGRPDYAPPAGSRFESAVQAQRDETAGASGPPTQGGPPDGGRPRRRGLLDRLLGR